MSVPTKNNYATLLKALRKEIAHGQEVIERQQTVTYWNVGHLISEHILQGDRRAGYGQETFEKLSQDLDIGVATIERAVRFSREFPISAARQKLRWTHYKTLLGVHDPKVRAQLQKKAEKENLTTRQLQDEVTQLNAEEKQHDLPQPETLTQLKLIRGELYTYQIIHPAAIPEAFVDCGFNFWKRLPQRQTDFRSGSIVTTVKKEEGYTLMPSSPPGRSKALFTYKAYLERVIDGDTLWVNIDLGFGNVSRQKLRLSRIDTPEINTPEGRKAKKFVEKALKPLDFFVVKTYKHDKYTRYLVDVFYLPSTQDPQAVADAGTLLNQELLDHGLAKIYSV